MSVMQGGGSGERAGAGSLRDYAAEVFTDAFGEPERFRTVDGTLYRWVAKGADRTIRITLDSPEFPDVAHILISDTRAAVRLSAETCRTRDDVAALLRKLREVV
jgi:hypothetical protein